TKGILIFYVIVYFVAATLLSKELAGLSTRVVGGDVRWDMGGFDCYGYKRNRHPPVPNQMAEK
ncbi:hypothetical protein M1N21_02065, partial [Dehalococcoidia bacterium]|nr:hypothetical protein [Dehalococcoidia bacterium]MCL0070696.1 hypothetical protein [Dehalococcoidia bacterium]